jgi:integrase/recombinase XerD
MLLEQGKIKFLQYMDTIDRSPQTIIGYNKDLTQFNKYIIKKYNCKTHIQNITSQDIEDYLVYLKKEKNYAPASRSRNLYTIRSFFSWAYKKNIITRNISLSVESIKLQQKERIYLTHNEIEKLLKSIKHPLINLVVRTLYMTGLRVSECLNLTLNTVDLNKKVIHVISGKGNKDRIIPISDKLYLYLKKYIEKDRPNVNSNIFFATKNTGKLSSQYINKTLAEVTKKLGWSKKVTCHTLRHSFATRLVEKDINLVQIQKLLGHSNLKVTSIYTHSSINKLKSAVNSIYKNNYMKNIKKLKENTEYKIDFNEFITLLITLQENKHKLLDILNSSKTKTIPKYVLPKTFITRSIHIVEPLDKMIIDFSKENNISEKEIFTIALIEFFREYGYEKEIERLIKIK